MNSTLTSKGQVTIPKRVRDALRLKAGNRVEFSVNKSGEVVLHKVGTQPKAKPDRFERMRGQAQVKWRTDQLMELLRGE